MIRTYGAWSGGTIRTIVMSALVAAVFGLLGCVQGADVPEAGSDEPVTAKDGSAEEVDTGGRGIDTGEELMAYFEAEHGDEAWVQALEDVVIAKKLGSTVVELHFGGARDDAARLADAAFGVVAGGHLNLDAWIEAWVEGAQFAGTGSGTPRERAVPPQPTTAEELSAWLDTVYGGEPERWHQAIETIELGSTAGGAPAIVVQTSLVSGDAGDREQAGLLLIAIADAGPTFAREVEVWYAERMGMLSGSTASFNPYVY